MDAFSQVVWLAEHSGELSALRDQAANTRAALGYLFDVAQTDDVPRILEALDRSRDEVALMAFLLVGNEAV